jgi:hypothetical protein
MIQSPPPKTSPRLTNGKIFAWIVLVLLSCASFCALGQESMAVDNGFLGPYTTGLLVSGAEAVLQEEGRFGPKDIVVFAKDRYPYRWMYLSALPEEKDKVGNISVETQSGSKQFDNAVLATKRTLAVRGFSGDYGIARMRVNQGLGSRSDDKFFADEIHLVDGTPDFVSIDPIVKGLLDRCSESAAKEGELLQALDELKKAHGSAETRWDEVRQISPRLTWSSEKHEVELICAVEAKATEDVRGIGIVPSPPFRRHQTETLYGLQLSVQKQLTFHVPSSGKVEFENKPGVQMSVESLPPPGGTVPRE